jgi:hypothetical protein
MTDVQVGSVHYFQRPDQDYVHVDSTATSLAVLAETGAQQADRARCS